MSSKHEEDADAREILTQLVALHHRNGGVTCSERDCADLWCRAARLACADMVSPGSTTEESER